MKTYCRDFHCPMKGECSRYVSRKKLQRGLGTPFFEYSPRSGENCDYYDKKEEK